MRSSWLQLAALAVALTASPAIDAAPAKVAAPNEPEHVIPPGHEDAARELLRDALDQTGDDLQWLGPSIEIDRIKWWLERDGQTLVELVALPRALGERGRADSESFTIVTHETEGVTLDDAQRQLLDVAVASIQARDSGDFYVHRETAFEGVPPYMRGQPSTPEEVRRRWTIEFATVGLLALAAIGVTFRPRPRS